MFGNQNLQCKCLQESNFIWHCLHYVLTGPVVLQKRMKAISVKITYLPGKIWLYNKNWNIIWWPKFCTYILRFGKNLLSLIKKSIIFLFCCFFSKKIKTNKFFENVVKNCIKVAKEMISNIFQKKLFFNEVNIH